MADLARSRLFRARIVLKRSSRSVYFPRCIFLKEGQSKNHLKRYAGRKAVPALRTRWAFRRCSLSRAVSSNIEIASLRRSYTTQDQSEFSLKSASKSLALFNLFRNALHGSSLFVPYRRFIT